MCHTLFHLQEIDYCCRIGGYCCVWQLSMETASLALLKMYYHIFNPIKRYFKLYSYWWAWTFSCLHLYHEVYMLFEGCSFCIFDFRSTGFSEFEIFSGVLKGFVTLWMKRDKFQVRHVIGIYRLDCCGWHLGSLFLRRNGWSGYDNTSGFLTWQNIRISKY